MTASTNIDSLVLSERSTYSTEQINEYTKDNTVDCKVCRQLEMSELLKSEVNFR